MSMAGMGGAGRQRVDQVLVKGRSGGLPPAAQSLVVRANQVIVFGPTGAIVGVFVYAVGTTPGPGNPPVASLTNQTHDPFGNVVVAGTAGYITIAGNRYATTIGDTALGSFAGGLVIQNQTSPANQPASVSAIPAATGSQMQLASGTGTGLSQPAVVNLIDSLNSGFAGGQIQLGVPGGGVGNVEIAYNSGLAVNVQGALSDLAIFTANTAAFVQFSKAWSIPAGDAQVGSVYRIRITGNGVQGSTAQALNIALQLAGTNFGGSGIASGFAAASANFAFWAELEVVCVTTGVAGTFRASKIAWAGDSAGHNQFAVDDTGATTIAVNTTIANTFEAIADWGAIVGAPIAVSRKSVFERVV